jgi:chromosome partitioning protein
MSVVIAIMNLKGGVGKTTLATLIASVLATESQTLLVDLDPQGSASSWHKRQKGNIELFTGTATRATLQKINQLSQNYEYVIVDLPPRLGETNEFAFKFANLILCPVVPGQLDLDATAVTMALLRKADIPWRFVANRLRRTKLTTQLLEVLGAHALKSALRDRNAYAEWGAGARLPRGPALIDMEKLVDEIKTQIRTSRT